MSSVEIAGQSAANRASATLIDLSRPDNSEYCVGRSKFYWALWYFLGDPLVRSRLLPFSGFKCLLMRAFGARIGKRVHWKPGVAVKFPWYLKVGDHCWIGENVWIDNLAEVHVGSNVCISQGAYLCTGNHDWTTPNLKLFRQPILLEDGCWVGAKVVVCPGVSVGAGAVIAAGAVISKNVPAFQVWGGNPAVYLKRRRLSNMGGA